MANKSYYHRSFIILKSEDKGYELISGKNPTGYCKFEIRKGVGKAHIYIQDIKPSSALDGIYEAYLVSADESIKPCKLASIQVDEQGRGGHVATFDSEDIKGSGYSLERFHALVITFRSGILGKNMRITYPMIGYSSQKVNIHIQRITEDLKGILGGDLKGLEEHSDNENMPELEPEQEPEFELEEEEEIEVRLEEEVGAKPEEQVEVPQEAEAGLELELEPELEPEVELEEADDSIPYTEENNQENDEETLRQAYADNYGGFLEDLEGDMQTPPGYTTTYWDNVKDYFIGLFKAHYGVSPFEEYMGDAKWVRVQQSSAGNQGYYTESPYQYPYQSNFYPDHYLVGLIKEEGNMNYVVYGIPSMYSMIPPISINGYSRWVPIKNGYGMGYWLLYIDAVSGSVVHPYKKE